MTAESAPRVAVLVACHDDAATIHDTIDSIRLEPDLELVVVDDGSRDPATVEALVVLEDQGVRVIRQPNRGPSAAWTRGLAATSAPYAMPFSSDDILEPGAVAVLANALDADPEAGFAWGDIRTFGLATAYRPSVPALCPWLVTFANAMPAYSLFRRTLLVESGGWQEIKASEDWDLWLRFASRGVDGVYVGRLIYRYRRAVGGRFQRRGNRYEPFYDELRTRNAELFAARRENRRRSPAPAALKALVPLVDALPAVPRLKKMQLTEALTLFFWSGGLLTTVRIVAQGILFRSRVRRGRRRREKVNE